MPLWTTDLADCVPSMLAITLTVAHCTVSELLTMRTLGKLLVSARVVAVDGSRPRPGAILVRNLFKGLVLVIPVLAVIAMLNPHLQGLGDAVARTVVVRDPRRRPDRPSNDR